MSKLYRHVFVMVLCDLKFKSSRYFVAVVWRELIIDVTHYTNEYLFHLDSNE